MRARKHVKLIRIACAPSLGGYILGEYEVRVKLKAFIERNIKNIRKLSGEAMIEESAMNPFLIKALGIKDFDALAKFYVYQRVGRSIVTSFGTMIEHIVRELSNGEQFGWWDVKASIDSSPYYMSVKSGPRDMDKDQVSYFARQAKEVMDAEPEAVPVIAMGYGKSPWPIIPGTLHSNGLDPEKHLLLGKKLYERITGESDYHVRLLEIIGEVARRTLYDRKVIDIIEEKVEEISTFFKRTYETVDDLLLDTF